MNWTSTQYTAWTEQCDALASQKQPFRLDHVSGLIEKTFCTELCDRHHYRQKDLGSSVLFTPISN